MELRNTEVRVESTKVGDGVKPTSALASQEVMGMKIPLVLWQLNSTPSPTPGKEGHNFFP